MPKTFLKTSNITTILLLLLAAVFVVLAILNDSNERKRRIELQEVTEKALRELRNNEEYRHQVEHAELILRSGDGQGAIAKLESAIALARKRGVLPRPTVNWPSNGETLLIEPYHDDARQGRPHAQMKEFEAYMRSTYPRYPLDKVLRIRDATRKE